MYRQGTNTCARTGSGAFTERCIAIQQLPGQEHLQGYAYRLPRGVTVLDGFVDARVLRSQPDVD